MIEEKDKLKNLCREILDWWSEHKYDSFSDGEDERNTYSDEPSFVKMARRIMNEVKL